MSRYLIKRANFLVAGVLAAFLALIGGMTWERFNAAATARAWTDHSYQVMSAVMQLAIELRGAETGQRGYLLTGDKQYLAPYTAAVPRIGILQHDLARLTADNPTQQERLRELAPLIRDKLAELARTIELRRDVGAAAAQAEMQTDTGRRLMEQSQTLLTAMTDAERSLLSARLVESANRAATVRLLVATGSLLAVGLLIWAAWLLNMAWRRSYEAEAQQRVLALRLNTALDSLSQGVAVFGPQRRLRNWNTCFQVLLDVPHAALRAGVPYAALSDLTDADGNTLLETEDQLRFGAQAAEGARTGHDPIVYERRHRGGHYLEIRRTPMPDGGFVLTLSDMTKRAQAEAVLREAQKMQAIGQLTGGIAHDFNNLLTVILGNLEFVRAKLEQGSSLDGRVERAVWAAQRGATLTSQLLAFARKQPLAPVPIDLSATLPTLVPLLRRTLGEHIDVRYVDSAGLWPALADPAQLESAALNLALNARDAMPGGGRLTIELANKVLDADYARQHAEVTAGDYVMLAVSDTGHGMTPEVAARVFEPFFTTKPEGKGTGLGLAMVFGFVKQSCGHVKIYSEPAVGTTVRIYLPRAVGVAAPGQRSQSPVVVPRGSAVVLVVEDEPAVREIAVAILTDLGYRVIEAADAEEGLRVFGEHAADVDLLLTDVVLPGPLRGRDLAERIAAIRPQVKVLYMSGYTENSIVHHGRLDDGVHLISKPFKREDFARKVAEVLGATRAATEDESSSKVVDLRPRRRD